MNVQGSVAGPTVVIDGELRGNVRGPTSTGSRGLCEWDLEGCCILSPQQCRLDLHLTEAQQWMMADAVLVLPGGLAQRVWRTVRRGYGRFRGRGTAELF